MATKSQTVEARALILGLIIPIVGSIFPFCDGYHGELWQPLPKNRDMATKSQLLRLELCF